MFYQQSVFRVHEAERHLTYQGCTILPSVQWSGRTCRPDIQGGSEENDSGYLEDRISRFLFAYRTTPHTTTGVSPAEFLMGQKLKTRLELVRPGLEERVIDSQARQKEGHDRTARNRVLQAGDTIYARNHNKRATWIPAKIVEATGPLSFRCQLADQRIVR